MPVIFGQEVKPRTLWIAGGVIVAGVVAIVYLRSRAAAEAPAAAPSPAPDFGGGGGGGAAPVAVPAPTDQAAANYNAELAGVQLDVAKFGLQQQQEQLREQKAQFDLGAALQQAYNTAQGALFGQQAAFQGEVLTQEQKQLAKTGISCAGKDSPRYGIIPGSQPPQLGWFCRQKTSGGFLGIPIGDISRSVQNFFSGVEAAAPQIGYNAGQAAGAYYTQRLFPMQGQQRQGFPQQQPYYPQQMPQQFGYLPPLSVPTF